MKHEPFLFANDQLLQIGGFIGESLRDRLQVRILALTVQCWHVHLVTDASAPASEIVKCTKDAVRYGLRPGRPIWTNGYDKRSCFDRPTLRGRVG